MSVHSPSADERLLSPTLVPRIVLFEFLLSLSSKPCTSYVAKNSQQTIQGTVIRSNRGGARTATKINVKQKDKKRFYTTTVVLTISRKHDGKPRVFHKRNKQQCHKYQGNV